MIESGETVPGTHTELSGNLDNNHLSPVKTLTESTEEKKLAGGAKDLSNAGKRSTSLPNLTWDNIENSLFHWYPTRNKSHVIRNRTMSEGDAMEVDYTKWSNKDFFDGSELVLEQELCVPMTESENLGSELATADKELVQFGGVDSGEVVGALVIDRKAVTTPTSTPAVEQELCVPMSELEKLGSTPTSTSAVEQELCVPMTEPEKLGSERATADKDLVQFGGANSGKAVGAFVIDRKAVLTPTSTPVLPMHDGSPTLKNAKRNLAVSPSTPIGLPRKHLFPEQRQELRQVTFGEDTEMTDLEAEDIRCNIQYRTKGDMSQKVSSSRRIIKGGRRDYNLIDARKNLSENKSPSDYSFWNIGSKVVTGEINEQNVRHSASTLSTLDTASTRGGVDDLGTWDTASIGGSADDLSTQNVKPAQSGSDHGGNVEPVDANKSRSKGISVKILQRKHKGKAIHIDHKATKKKKKKNECTRPPDRGKDSKSKFKNQNQRLIKDYFSTDQGNNSTIVGNMTEDEPVGPPVDT